jgi:hypothetical protein
LGYPPAALFGFCVALIAYMILAAVKAAIASVHGTETVETKISGYYLGVRLLSSIVSCLYPVSVFYPATCKPTTLFT